ncbi:group 10 secretory phospholipase A2 [Eleutherodactylus coqui]|uniref:group 10 secretory phospholipase A2 n=1 Tax=Eleutherodactylus coqui TaxID=57060 RepID=UPI003462D878
MELEIFLMFFLCGCLNGDPGRSQARQKRGIFELPKAIECGTGRAAVLYLNYGCYCGLGGKGRPVDYTDWCCYKHDSCYGIAERCGCHPHFNSYKWKCVNRTVICEPTNDVCQNRACKCDKDLARCLQKAPYKVKHFWYPDSLCVA